MALQFDSIVIDRVLNATAEADGDLYLLNQLSNVNISNTSQSKDKTDANGVLVKRFYTGKTVEFSADTSMLSFSLMGEQFGSPKEIGQLTVPRFLTINTKGLEDYTLPEAPTEDITAIWELYPNGTSGKKFTVSSGVTEDNFTYDSAQHKITFPTNAPEQLFVKYEYQATNAVRVTQSADKFPRTVKLTLNCLVVDTCDVDTYRQAYIVFPSFQVSPDCEISLETDATFNFSGVAQVDYCSADKELYSIMLSEDDVVED